MLLLSQLITGKQFILKLKQSLFKGILASLLTVLVYQFYYIEFIRSNVEDSAFDTMSWIILSREQTQTDSSNILLLMVDDSYLKSKNLLDENNETRYGYIFPREYLAEIIASVDTLTDDVDTQNRPKALFLDYDLSYCSDPLNITKSHGDQVLIDVLKKERSYTIYLPMTSNYNYIYHDKDERLQELIKNGKIKFVSVGLASAGDNISRRYYPYETYNDVNNTPTIFPNISIALWSEAMQTNMEINTTFHQKRASLIENRIIFKNKHIEEDKEFTSWQSNWQNLSGVSANFPLDMIYEEILANAVIMVGPSHQLSSDNFGIDKFGNGLSGVEMHANALMTLYYLDGKLKRFSLWLSIFIVFIVVSLVDIFLGMFYPVKKAIVTSILSKNIVKKIMFSDLKKESKKCSECAKDSADQEKNDFQDKWFVLFSMIILMGISYCIFIFYKEWFNWMIPTLMSLPYVAIVFLFKKFNNKKR
jgi:hypothetical protein